MHQARTYENQMRGKQDDSLGLREEKKEKEGAHKAVRVCVPASLPACQMRGSLRWPSEPFLCGANMCAALLAIDVSNLRLSREGCEKLSNAC